ncbi:MAG: galactosamine-6-phosphate isomerase [Mangrovibacterium sp.]
MNIEILATYEELSRKAGNLIIAEIKRKKNLLLCAATGGSPAGTYRLLGQMYQEQPDLFDQLRIVKLDEWGGIPMDHPATCETYLKTHMTGPLQINRDRYIGFNSNPDDPVAECRNIRDKLDHEGPIDLCILGIGMNGHIAFNEPAGFLQPYCHVSVLSASSLQHPMASDMKIKPTFGLTLGMGDIFHARMILMLINGPQKKNMVKKLLSQKISTEIPASFLWLHPNAYCLIEENAMEG